MEAEGKISEKDMDMFKKLAVEATTSNMGYAFVTFSNAVILSFSNNNTNNNYFRMKLSSL